MGRRHDELMERAASVPVLRACDSQSLIAQKAEGPRVYDVDNVGYIDYIGAGGATIVGYANPFVLDAVRKVLQGGIPEGFHVPLEVDLAKTLGHFLPWVSSWWFCRSQDDAFQNVLHWARRTTGKKNFLVLDGGAPLRVGAPAGLSIQPSNPIREVKGWDVPKIIAAITSGSSKVAAVIIDPLMGRFGVVPPPDGVLEEIADACRSAEVLLVVDERVSGFRVGRGGASEVAGIKPDVAVYGAALGGGFPIGVVAFREPPVTLDYPDPVLTPHPVSLAASEAILYINKHDAVYERLDERAGQLVHGLLELAEKHSRPMTINRMGSVFAIYFTGEPVVNHKGLKVSDGDAYRRFAALLRDEGTLLPREPGRAAFVSSTHGAKDIDETLSACDRVLLALQKDLP
jgi:glutamate-1-semialdehyde 2,1-aminomutase